MKKTTRKRNPGIAETVIAAVLPFILDIARNAYTRKRHSEVHKPKPPKVPPEKVDSVKVKTVKNPPIEDPAIVD